MEHNDDYRFARVDEAIRKLADVSTDLSKAIAVLDQRTIHVEKQIDTTVTLIERRRDLIDAKISELVADVHSLEDKLKKEVKDIADYEHQNLKDHAESERALFSKQLDEHNKQLEDTQKKIWLIEKGVWVGGGAAAILGFIVSAALGLFHITISH